MNIIKELINIKNRLIYLNSIEFTKTGHRSKLHGDVNQTFINYINDLIKNSIEKNIIKCNKTDVYFIITGKNNEKLNEIIDIICNVITNNKVNFSIAEYNFNNYELMKELEEKEINNIIVERNSIILDTIDKKSYDFLSYLGIKNDDEIKIFKESFNFEKNIGYAKSKIPYIDFYKDELPNDKPLFFSERDYDIKCYDESKDVVKEINECNFEDIPLFMPEYNYYSKLYDKMVGIGTTGATAGDNIKKARFLSKFRLAVIGDNRYIKKYVLNSKYYIAEPFFSSNPKYFTKQQLEYYKKIPSTIKWSLKLNKSIIQLLTTRNLIFPIAINIAKIKNQYAEINRYLPEDILKNSDLLKQKIKAIMYYKLHKNKRYVYMPYFIIENKEGGIFGNEPYSIFNCWGVNAPFTSFYTSGRLLVQFTEINVIEYVMKTIFNSCHFYKYEDLILVSRFSINEIKEYYTKYNCEDISSKLVELCNKKLTNPNNYKLYEWQIDEEELKSNLWKIYDIKKDIIPYAISDKCDKYIEILRKYKIKYIKYKYKYLTLKKLLQ